MVPPRMKRLNGAGFDTTSPALKNFPRSAIGPILSLMYLRIGEGIRFNEFTLLDGCVKVQVKSGLAGVVASAVVQLAKSSAEATTNATRAIITSTSRYRQRDHPPAPAPQVPCTSCSSSAPCRPDSTQMS